MELSELSSVELNDIVKDAMKYREKKLKYNQYISTYITQKREEKNPKYIELSNKCSKTYYEKNKEIINKKKMEKYYKKKAEREALEQSSSEDD
jgi:hypothetical protein